MTDVADDGVVLFAGRSSLDPGELEFHSLKDRLFGRSIEDVQKDWARVSSQVAKLVDATSSTQPKGFELESIEVSLAFTASGQLAFIAEAGIEASVSVTLKRPSTQAAR